MKGLWKILSRYGCDVVKEFLITEDSNETPGHVSCFYRVRIPKLAVEISEMKISVLNISPQNIFTYFRTATMLSLYVVAVL